MPDPSKAEWSKHVRTRLAFLRLSPAREAEIVEELSQHLEQRYDALRRAGTSDAEAQRLAIDELLEPAIFGTFMRRLRQANLPEPLTPGAAGGSWLRDLRQDLRYAVRLLRKQPGFAAAAILTLALGIGANTAIFALVDALRIRSLPVASPHELAIVKVTNQSWVLGSFSGGAAELTYPQWEVLRDTQQTFSGLLAWSSGVVDLASRGESRFAENAVWVSGEFFNLLGIRPALGRVFTAADDVKGCRSPGVVLSHAFWRREFSGDPAIVGRPLTINGHALEIIGVSAAGFSGVEVGRSFDLAVPLCADGLIYGGRSRLEDRSAWWLSVMGRLATGSSQRQANANLAALSPSLFRATLPSGVSAEAAAGYLGFTLGAVEGASGYSRLRQDYDTPLALLLAVAGIVLVIACANLANLLLARAGAREREMAVRLAIGASRGRLLRQLLTESLLLAAIGATLGGWLSQALSQGIIDIISSPVSPLFVDLTVHWRVLAFTAGLALLTCILFGLWPAVRSVRIAPAESLKAAARHGLGRAGLRRALVAVQIALSLTLLVGGLLFSRSLFNLLTLDAGFQQDGILEADVDLTKIDLSPEARQAFRRDLLDRIRAIPEVESAAAVSTVPLVGNWWRTIYADGPRRERQGNARFNRVTADYFATMRTALVAGRDFDTRDTPASPAVVIVNESFARRFLGSGLPLGATFRLEGPTGAPDVVVRIVGLVQDTKYNNLREEPGPIAYLASSQQERLGPFDQILIRSRTPMARLQGLVSRVLDGTHAAISFHFHDFQEQIRYSLLRDRLMAALCGFFAALAAILATIGVYAMASYSAVQRTSEIGIRLALGAHRGDILRLIFRETAMVVAAGIVAGATLAFVSTRAARSLLYGVEPNDPATLIGGVVLVASVAAAATYLPARRAAMADPVAALRCE